ncbi:MAG TPA: hypothetical protein VGK60_03540 [Pedococcus sp.]|jgi:uncharacterized membrane protein YgaE (UPF0421/DUF939 family)
MRRLVVALHHPLTALAAKSAVAAGVAFWVGSLLPGHVGRYHYYAALGAYSVIYPAVSDSLRHAARALAAVSLGAAVAVVLQLAAWTNPVTIGLAVGAGVALGALRWIRAQGSWTPVVALFVLAVGGAAPEQYVAGYVVQILVGAVVGLVANFVLFTPLPVYELETSVGALRGELATQLHEVVAALEADDREAADRTLSRLPELTPARERVRRAIAEVRRARRGNPRARRATSVHRALFDLGEALQRCSSSVEAVAVVMLERDDEAPLVDDLRERTVALLDALARLFELPTGAVPDKALVREVRQQIAGLLDAVESQDLPHRESRFVAGAAAVSARRCLRAFVTAYDRSASEAVAGGVLGGEVSRGPAG